MVRAAAAGVIDYTRADPKDINWKMRHRLLLSEMKRQEEQKLLEATHRHWLTYVLKSDLTPEGTQMARDSASDALIQLQRQVFPWLATAAEKPEQKDTIDDVNAALIAKWRQLQAARNQTADPANG